MPKEVKKFQREHKSWNTGKKRPEMIGYKNPFWKGGLPYCLICKKQLSARINKTSFCKKCYHKKYKMKCAGWNKGKKFSIKIKKKMSLSKQGIKHWNWKGGRYFDGNYIRIKDEKHPFVNCLGYVYEHRKVMENQIGRYLKPQESIHHINKIKTDNRIENLRLFANEGLHSKYEKRLRKEK